MTKNNTVDVFLDLDPGGLEKLNITDGELATAFLGKFQPILTSIGRRIRETKSFGIFYDTPSVALFEQAKDLFILGYFVSTIMVCRSISEYLAYEIFYEEVELVGPPELIKTVAENLDFKKIVNEFLYNPGKNYFFIDKNSCDIFNEIYSIGNSWVHPNNSSEPVNIELEAKKTLDKTQSLIHSLRDVMKDHFISNGVLVKKQNARKKIRPIVLGSSLRKNKIWNFIEEHILCLVKRLYRPNL